MSASPGTPGTPPRSVQCGAHPTEPALDVCTRCGGFLCWDCLTSAYGEPACGPCAKVLGAIDRRLPAGLVMAWILSVLGVLAFPAGIAGAIMAVAELGKARARHAPAPIQERAEGALRTAVGTVTVNLVLFWNAWPYLRSMLLD